MSLLSRVLHFASVLARVPNAPFLHGPALRELVALLSEMGIRHAVISADASRGAYEIDEFGLYVRFQRGQANLPLLIDSHLDHPGFVLDGRGCAIAFGSVGLARIRRLLEGGSIDLRVFEPNGGFLTLGQITELQPGGKPIVRVETPIPVPPNSHGLWNVSEFKADQDTVTMGAADNVIMTAILLALIESLVLSPCDFPDLDVTFAFTFLEEVFQISASGIAARGSTPFGPINKDWMILVLEAMEVAPLTIHADLYGLLARPRPHHGAGLAIKVNDRDCVYGYEFPDQANLMETALLSAAQDLGISHQHTVCGGACNATSYSVFRTSAHIAALAVPNPYKHNTGPDGSVRAEQIRTADIDSAIRLLERILRTPREMYPSAEVEGMSLRLKRTQLMPSPSAARRLRAERGTIAWSARSRLRRMRYFGEGPGERLGFGLRSGLARIRQLALSRTIYSSRVSHGG